MDTTRALASAKLCWATYILPILEAYIRIPNVSPNFDPNWAENGHMARAVGLLAGWAREQPISGLTVEIVRLPDRTPLIYMEVPGTGAEGTVLLYGHLDKQPEAGKWRDGLSPWTPVREGDRLYGRAAADDGYAIFSALTAIRLLEEQGVPHARCVVLIEADEESGSGDLPFYVEHLAARIGTPDLIVCLDSGCGDYEHLWLTPSLRGLVNGVLNVGILTQGVHSGDASGVAAETMRIMRILLSRLDDEKTGRVNIRECYALEIPQERMTQAVASAAVLGDSVYTRFPWVPGAQPMHLDPAELILGRTWYPYLAVTGAEGLPTMEKAGNVLRPETSLKLSMRLPPTVDPQVAAAEIKRVLESEPPYGARVTFTPGDVASGWNAPPLAPWLEASIDRASQAFFGKPARAVGEGGTIPFMKMLGDRFPEAQFMVTGLLGPGANAHGPDEFLHIPTAERLTASVAKVLADHANR